MNTPSNAGKEHNPDSLTPEQYGAPEWRLLTKGETIKQGDEYWCADWFDSVTTGVATTYMTAFTYRRRTTPPTQSQEGETPKGEWGIEEFGNKLWVGPMRRDGKLNEVVCIFDLEDLKPEAEIRKRQLANIIVQCVNNAGPQSNAIRDAENHADAAQRENDRLRSALSQIAELNGDGDAQQFKLTRFQAAQIARKALSDAARAATEEGKRG